MIVRTQACSPGPVSEPYSYPGTVVHVGERGLVELVIPHGGSLELAKPSTPNTAPDRCIAFVRDHRGGLVQCAAINAKTGVPILGPL